MVLGGEWVGCATSKLLLPLFPRVASGITGVDTMMADVSDQASLEAMCASTSVLINCVGPVSEVQTYLHRQRQLLGGYHYASTD